MELDTQIMLCSHFSWSEIKNMYVPLILPILRWYIWMRKQTNIMLNYWLNDILQYFVIYDYTHGNMLTVCIVRRCFIGRSKCMMGRLWGWGAHIILAYDVNKDVIARSLKSLTGYSRNFDILGGLCKYDPRINPWNS